MLILKYENFVVGFQYFGERVSGAGIVNIIVQQLTLKISYARETCEGME